MKKKRILDSEHAMMLKRQEKEGDKKLQQIKAQKKQKWKKMSEEFRSIIKANNTTTGFGSISKPFYLLLLTKTTKRFFVYKKTKNCFLIK